MLASEPSRHELRTLDPASAARRLQSLPTPLIVARLTELGPARSLMILERFAADRRRAVEAAAGPQAELWERAAGYPEDSVGRIMEAPIAVFEPDMEVAAVLAPLRELVGQTLITYLFITDPDQSLLGVVTFRELLFAAPGARLKDLMIPKPFALAVDQRLDVALRSVLERHFPVYPVVDAGGRLVGIVRGQVLVEEQTDVMSAQPGALVGVDREERLATPWARCFRSRHPWLQLNLFSAFLAGGTVALFQDQIDEIVLLAVFLPVLALQCGNTGAQAMAVTLRGLTLGELGHDNGQLQIRKEAWLGLLNGLIVGLVCALVVYLAAQHNDEPRAVALSLIMLIAMTGSCIFSGAAGAMVPLMMQRFGTDPATASTIVLTTATDVMSMGMFLLLVRWWLF